VGSGTGSGVGEGTGGASTLMVTLATLELSSPSLAL
jgi:hypothetical protein